MPELREKILLFSYQVLFLILRGDERPPSDRYVIVVGSAEGILPMIYIASNNPSLTHYRFRPLIDNTSFTRVMSPTS